MDMFDYLVFIGRFQPFHLAHLQMVNIALKKSKSVILVLGSAQNERTLKNPFLAKEREEMILLNFNSEQRKRIIFAYSVDVYNDTKWVEQVKSQVNAKIKQPAKIGLIGYFKDDSSYYLKLFSEWTLVQLDSLENCLSATPLRHAFLDGKIETKFLPDGTIKFLTQFQNSENYIQLKQQYLNTKLSKNV